jgi:hypothetical protein
VAASRDLGLWLSTGTGIGDCCHGNYFSSALFYPKSTAIEPLFVGNHERLFVVKTQNEQMFASVEPP